MISVERQPRWASVIYRDLKKTGRNRLRIATRGLANLLGTEHAEIISAALHNASQQYKGIRIAGAVARLQVLYT